MGARGRRPLWSPLWVPVTFGHCFLFIFSFYSLFFTALPCPALTLPCPYPCPSLALAPALPCFEFSFWCQGQEEEVTQGTGNVFFFLLLPGTGGGSYTGNGQCFFFPFATRDRRRKLHREWVLKARPYVHVVGSVWAHAKAA